MKVPSAPIGAIVRVWFPETESVLRPGPKFRPALVLDVATKANGAREALVAYGTSQRSEQFGKGEFVLPARLTTSLCSDTRFCLTRRVWLSLTMEYFGSSGRQPLPEPFPETMLKFFIDAAKEAGLV